MDSYEKKYKEALEKAKEFYILCKKCGAKDTIDFLEDIFSELKKSEDDRIRKALIRFHKSSIDIDGIKGDDILAWLEKQGEQPSAIRWYDVSLIPQEMEELLVEWDSEDATWHEVAFYHADTKTFWNGTRQVENVTRWCYIIDLLEKQGEQKPADKVEPKFKIGDFIVNDYCMGRIVEITNDAYLLDTGQGIPFSCEHNAHLWTIQDAKDGDVLYSPCLELLWIFKNRDSVYCGCNLSYNNGAFCVEGYFEMPTDAIPATKEQHDTLMKAMTDAGWEFDFDKKELKKISQRMVSAEVKEAMYDKPAWSKEDEDILEDVEEAIINYWHGQSQEDLSDWLKSLKDRVQPQLKQEWSEEDEKKS